MFYSLKTSFLYIKGLQRDILVVVRTDLIRTYRTRERTRHQNGLSPTDTRNHSKK